MVTYTQKRVQPCKTCIFHGQIGMKHDEDDVIRQNQCNIRIPRDELHLKTSIKTQRLCVDMSKHTRKKVKT